MHVWLCCHKTHQKQNQSQRNLQGGSQSQQGTLHKLNDIKRLWQVCTVIQLYIPTWTLWIKKSRQYLFYEFSLAGKLNWYTVTKIQLSGMYYTHNTFLFILLLQYAWQCISNTAPLRLYFLEKLPIAYTKHINRTNPLGMGGAIANAFANLLEIMWNGQNKCTSPHEIKVRNLLLMCCSSVQI